MAQQQTDYHPQTASQNAGDQHSGDNSGGVINYFNNGGSVTYYGGYSYMEAPTTAYAVQNGSPVGQTPGPASPGFTHMGHGVQQPPFSGTNVQSHVAHVCGAGKGPFTEQEQQILQALCSFVVKRSNYTRDCINTGAKATRTSIDRFIAGDEKAAKEIFWRRGQKNKSQRKCRAEKKQQKDQAKQFDLSQRYSANTPIHHQQMQLVDDNAGGFLGIQMQQEAQQMPLPHDLDLEMPVDPQLVLLPPVDLQFGLPTIPLPIQQNL